MKSSLTHSLSAKIVAIFLVTITFIITAGMATGIVLVAFVGGYEGNLDSAKEVVAKEFLYEYIDDIASSYYYGVDLPSEYENANFYYTIRDTDGKLLVSNYSDQKTIGSVQSIQRVDYRRTYNSKIGEYEYVAAATYDITLYCKVELSQSDGMSMALYFIDLGYNWRYAAIVLCIIGVILFFALMVFLYCSAGRRRGEEKAVLNKIDRIPFDLYTAFFVSIAFLEGAFLSSFDNDWAKLIAVIILGIFDFLLLLGYTMSFATRLKVGGLLKNTIIYKILSLLWRLLRKMFKGIGYMCGSLPLIWKTALFAGAITLINLIIAFALRDGAVVLIWFLETIIVVPTVLFSAAAFRRLQKGAEVVAGGDLSYQVDKRYMFWDFKRFADNLNNISAGMSRAVDERLKSERFKTELITNVSHDIKTPLTSIINYVDLIKKEKPESENMKEYVDVLDRQSSRLKKLIEDLVEASKASTGNLAVNFAPCEIGVLLAQTIGEYQGKLEAAGLELIINQPDDPVRIMADGRHLWRIFDNLMNNVCKYAQPGTRVYLDLETAGNRAIVRFRNISKYPLNITSEELMERFVRGDSSRNTEGSGLGLSIARSLIELQHGEMKLTVDGDLFKAILIFERMK